MCFLKETILLLILTRTSVDLWTTYDPSEVCMQDYRVSHCLLVYKTYDFVKKETLNIDNNGTPSIRKNSVFFFSSRFRSLGSCQVIMKKPTRNQRIVCLAI